MDETRQLDPRSDGAEAPPGPAASLLNFVIPVSEALSLKTCLGIKVAVAFSVFWSYFQEVSHRTFSFYGLLSCGGLVAALRGFAKLN